MAIGDSLPAPRVGRGTDPLPNSQECPGCGKGISKSQFGCSSCWYKLPPELRRRVWANYRKPFIERVMGLPDLYAEALVIWHHGVTADV